jgi:hypothetical protein
MYNLETQQGIIGRQTQTEGPINNVQSRDTARDHGPSVCVWRPMIPCCVSRLYIIDWSFCLCLAPNDPLLCL